MKEEVGVIVGGPLVSVSGGALVIEKLSEDRECERRKKEGWTYLSFRCQVYQQGETKRGEAK